MKNHESNSESRNSSFGSLEEERKKISWADHLKKAKELISGLAQGFEGSEMTISNLLKLATSASDLFKSSKPSVKNQILRLLVSNLKIKEKQLDFNPLEPFIYIKKLDSRPNWLPGLDSIRAKRERCPGFCAHR